jgi:hypothetical protein
MFFKILLVPPLKAWFVRRTLLSIQNPIAERHKICDGGIKAMIVGAKPEYLLHSKILSEESEESETEYNANHWSTDQLVVKPNQG